MQDDLCENHGYEISKSTTEDRSIWNESVWKKMPTEEEQKEEEEEEEEVVYAY